ncbi:hypothetical protein RF11_00426 [Thelohanellus kitauei]|uniref:Uncharacterized protein n=1 Tax=Thelohanellus kitauei TaxID=669202 RepID=A0A0C2MQN2_THEKT|nr:hypothetical protein RF11_00426 [Thelohanellus kitauei]
MWVDCQKIQIKDHRIICDSFCTFKNCQPIRYLDFFLTMAKYMYKHAAGHYCTNLTSIANATFFMCSREDSRVSTILQVVSVAQSSYLLNINPNSSAYIATLLNRYSFTQNQQHGSHLPSKSVSFRH